MSLLTWIISLFKPYMKPNDSPMYVNKKSNHPPCITKNLPAAVNQRLSSISANEEVFREAAPPYQEALNASGYDFALSFDPDAATKTRKKT